VTGGKKFDDQAHALIIQKHQIHSSENQLGNMLSTLNAITIEQRSNQAILDSLILQAESVIDDQEICFVFDEEDITLVESSLYITNDEIQSIHQPFNMLEDIEITASTDWKQYSEKIEAYATRHKVDFEEDPFRNLMSVSQRIVLEKRIKEDFSLKSANCDKYDYMIAGTCGLIGGLIDVFFVGLPGQGTLTEFTDNLTNKAVQQFAKLNGWNGSKEGKDPTASAIGFLEKNFSVNYDHRHGGDVDGLFNMSTKNHHIKSLGHSPDLVGLFFSILGQFTNTAYFVSDGKLISIDTKTFELKGSNFVSKVFSGFFNWIGHLFSDMAGSSGATGRGSGIPIPFYSLLQFINVGQFGQHRQTFATVAVQVFEKGYDLRHGMALAIPVLITELLTRIMWVVKQRFYYEKAWDGCIPSANNPELRRMLLISHGSLCLVDTTDATLRSGGNIIQFMLRSNFVAWARFGTLSLKELKAWYREGSLDIEAVDEYLESEYVRLLAT
jgi:hypothetical protein